MRLKTANKRRLRAMRRLERSRPRPLIDEVYRSSARLIGFDPGREVHVYGGGLGCGKTFAMQALRERMRSGKGVRAPDMQTWRDELMIYGTSYGMVLPARDGVFMRFFTREEFEREYPSDGVTAKG